MLIHGLLDVVSRMNNRDIFGTWECMKTLYRILPPNVEREVQPEYDRVLSELKLVQRLSDKEKGDARVRGSELRTKRQTVISETEFLEAMNQAGRINDTFLRLRALAILCLLRLTGKRRGEIALLPLSNFKVEDNFLNVTFILAKKRKEMVLSKTAKKSIPSNDSLAAPTMTYLEYLRSLDPLPVYFLPRVKSVFGNNYIVSNSHISGRQVFNVVRSVSETVWPHLFRETVASDIIKQDNSIIAAFKVQRRLDLESVNTGFNYLRRFSADIIQREEQ